MTDADYQEVAEALKIIAHPVRLKIIEILMNSEISVSDIQQELKLKQSITSQHLSSMKGKGILKSRRDGNVVYYSIQNKNILKIIDCMKSCKKS